MGRRRELKHGIGSDNRGFSGRKLACRRLSDIQGIMSQKTAGEIETLKMQAESIKSARDSINRRMEKLEREND
jgi:hypothetical protein